MDFSALILDDGELQILRDVLDKLEGAVTHRNARRFTEIAAGGQDVVIMTAKHAIDSESNFAAAQAPLPPRIVLHGQDFLPMRERIRKIGVDFLVNTNVCRDTLAHVIRSAVYHGKNRRAARRIPVGAQIRCQIGGECAAFTLAEISPRGCRLVGGSPAVLHGVAVLEIPADLCGGRALQLIGRIGRIDESPNPTGNRQVVGVEFGSQSQYARFAAHLRAGRAISARVTSFQSETSPMPSLPTRSGRTTATVPGPAIPVSPVALAAPPKDRRHNPRSSQKRRFVALLGSAVHQILGCDISAYGARIEQCSELGLGDKLTLGIPGRSPEEPLLVDGVVARDDGGQGLAVRFAVPDPTHAQWLERLIASLTPVVAEREGLA